MGEIFKVGDVVKTTKNNAPSNPLPIDSLWKILSFNGPTTVGVADARGATNINGRLAENFTLASQAECNAFRAGYTSLYEWEQHCKLTLLPDASWPPIEETYILNETEQEMRTLEEYFLSIGWSRCGETLHISNSNVFALYPKSKQYNFLSNLTALTHPASIAYKQIKHFLTINKTKTNDLQTTPVTGLYSTQGRTIKLPSSFGKITSASRLIGHPARGGKIGGTIKRSTLRFGLPSI